MEIETAPDIWSVRHVAENMRRRDFDEYRAMTGHTDRGLLANLLVGRYARRPDVMAVGDSEPIAIAGLIETRPGVIGLLFFATPKIHRVALPVTRKAREICDDCFARGAHRLECVTLAGYPQMHRWLLTLGLLPEGPAMRKWGANGEDFIQFARTA